MTDEEYETLSLAIQEARTLEQLEVARQRVLRVAESDSRLLALGGQWVEKAAELGYEATGEDVIQFDNTPLPQLTPEQRAAAVQLLRVELADSRDALRAAIAADPESWHSDHHFGFGLGVRNLLREHGYESNDIDMDGDWPRLVEEAMQDPP